MPVVDANSARAHWPTGWEVTHVAETGSTNADLVALAREGAAHHRVLVADHQTAGKGRLDRQWEAPPRANLLVSLLFRPHSSRPAHHYTHIVALSARTAAGRCFGVLPSLKWPNDLLVDERKVAGLLAQGGDDFVVVGIGVNVRWAPDGASRLGDEDSPGPLDLLGAMLPEIDRLESFSDDRLHDEYRCHLATIGRRVRIEMADGSTLVGDAYAVEVDGRLAVRADDGAVVLVEVGDVIHLRT